MMSVSSEQYAFSLSKNNGVYDYNPEYWCEYKKETKNSLKCILRVEAYLYLCFRVHADFDRSSVIRINGCAVYWCTQ